MHSAVEVVVSHARAQAHVDRAASDVTHGKRRSGGTPPRLESAGFQVSFSEQSVICAVSEDLCQVVDTDPPAGSQVAPGTEVTVSIDNA